MYLARTPDLVKPLLKELTWNVPVHDRTVFLTFDDGPEPGVTPWVLDQLAARGAKATFFCIGRNAAAQPALMDRLRREGHGLGNHTWDHANGWDTGTRAYLRSVLRCQPLTGTPLFRPPYGRITRAQSKALSGRFGIIMWEVLSADFDTTIDGAKCLHNVTTHVRPGAIVVFHDSLKAEPRLRAALPGVLEFLDREGYRCAPLPGSRPWAQGSTDTTA